MAASLRPIKWVRNDHSYTRIRHLVGETDFVRNYPFVFKEVLYSDDSTPWDKSSSKDCLHYSHSWTPRPCHWMNYDDYPGTIPKVEYLGYSREVDPFDFVVAQINQLPVLLAPPDWDKALYKVLPKMRNDFNLINFLLELDDIPKLIAKWQGIDEAILRVNFGALPLWADIKAFYRQLNTILNKLDRINLLLKYGVSASSTYLGKMIFHSDFDYGGIPARFTFNGTYVVRWTCKVTGSYSSNRVANLCDLLGLYPDLSTLWNAIPFSFLVDYLVPIGDALEGDPWSKMDLTASRACRSIDVEGIYTVNALDSKWVDYNAELNTVDALGLGNGAVNYYRRDSFPDAVFDGVDIGLSVGFPTEKQQLNAAALLSANRRSFIRMPHGKKPRRKPKFRILS